MDNYVLLYLYLTGLMAFFGLAGAAAEYFGWE
jgi:hypothetical protein